MFVIPVVAPQIVPSLSVGTVFFDQMPHHYPHIVAGTDSDPLTAKYVISLPREEMAADIFEVEEFANRAVLPVSIVKAFCNPAAVQADSGGGVPSPSGLAFANGAGYWMPVKGMWLNLSEGLLSKHRPSAPWVELGDLELRAEGDETIAQWSIFG